MADSQAKPTEAEVRSFVDKLEQFRETLPANEQNLLDALVVASANNEDEVAGFGIIADTLREAATQANREYVRRQGDGWVRASVGGGLGL